MRPPSRQAFERLREVTDDPVLLEALEAVMAAAEGDRRPRRDLP
jgi:hypothetical protein